MLTKDLIICRCRDKRLYPQFLRENDGEILEFAAELLEIYRDSLRSSRSSLDELASPVVSGQPNLHLAKGLRKVLEDRCDFSAPDEYDYPEERRKILHCSAEILRSQPWSDPVQYRQAVKARLPENPLYQTGTLYPDLPDNDRLKSVPEITPQQLIQRYNLDLVQGLLLQSRSLSIAISSPSVAKLRRIVQYLHFFRLLAEVTAEGGKLPETSPQSLNGLQMTGSCPALRLEISGPGSILDNSRRYGLQLANFFPALPSIEYWKMETELEWKGKQVKLLLDQTSGLICPYHFFSACLPQELTLFKKHFSENVSSWHFTEELPLIQLNGRQIVIPDFTFCHHDSGKTIALELFHCWHAKEVKSRLDWLQNNPGLPMIIGIDRSLLKDPELAEIAEKMPEYCFLFRDFPTLERTVKCLNLAYSRLFDKA